jgi:hypothetical protein
MTLLYIQLTLKPTLTLTKHTQKIYWEEFVENYVMPNAMILTQKNVTNKDIQYVQ